MHLFLQLLDGRLHHGNTPPCQFVNELGSADAGNRGADRLRNPPREYQSNAAATRISRTNSLGERRSADNAPSGTSNVILAIIPAATG